MPDGKSVNNQAFIFGIGECGFWKKLVIIPPAVGPESVIPGSYKESGNAE
jgi:hypothetical protein